MTKQDRTSTDNFVVATYK